jgi:pimeloyl-ACP methyl ester carboxylesterase
MSEQPAIGARKAVQRSANASARIAANHAPAFRHGPQRSGEQSVSARESTPTGAWGRERERELVTRNRMSSGAGKWLRKVTPMRAFPRLQRARRSILRRHAEQTVIETDQMSRQAKAAMLPVHDQFVEAPDGRLFTRTWGEIDGSAKAAPIVLFHDSLGSVELWRDFPARLASATGRPVLAYDRLGFGKSDPHPGKLAVDFIRQEASSSLAAVKARLNIGRMVLFGHSVGGGMAVAAGAAFPDAAEAVMTEAAQAFVEDRTLDGIREAQAAFEAPGQIERLARYHGDKARWVLEAWTRTWLSPEFATWTLDDDLRNLRCPLLAIHGDRDEYGTRRHPEQLGGLPPVRSEVLILQDCGHVPHREQPEKVVEAARAFLLKPGGAHGQG